MDRPSSINSKKVNKLTRRRVMKLAAAAGFPATAALTMTPEDVKASDSDQVTIPFDVTGKYKIQVPADQYDHAMRASAVVEDIKDRFSEKEGISGIGLTSKGRMARVLVYLDANHHAKDERRGEIPERQNDVAIDIEEQASEYHPFHLDEDGNCQPHEGECDDQTADVSQLPGGVESIPALGTTGTNGPRFINGSCRDYLFGWSIAAHTLGVCHETSNDDECGGSTGCAVSTEQPVNHNNTQFGNVVCVDYELDIAYVERLSGLTETNPVPEIVLPSDHSDAIHISGTVSESAMKTTVLNNADCSNKDETYPVTYRGIRSCEVDCGELVNVDFTDTGTKLCGETPDHQFEVKLEDTHGAPGDSGAVPYVEHEGDYFAIGSLSGGTDCDVPTKLRGPQGYSIRDIHNIWWDDL